MKKFNLLIALFLVATFVGCGFVASDPATFLFHEFDELDFPLSPFLEI